MKWNTKGMLAVEALVGFILFSFILTLYLPGFLTAYQQLQTHQQQTQAWRWTYEGCRFLLSHTNDAALDTYLSQRPAIQQIKGDATSCQLTLINGVTYEIQLQNTAP